MVAFILFHVYSTTLLLLNVIVIDNLFLFKVIHTIKHDKNIKKKEMDKLYQGKIKTLY